MADYSESKRGVGALEPTHAVATSSFDRLEPLITAERVRREFCFGIDLVSQIKSSTTGKRDVMDNVLLGEIVLRAVSNVETDTGMDLFPVQRKEKHPFDRAAYDALGYFKLEHRPAYSVEQMAVVPANNVDVYKVPLDWIETAYLEKGQVNIVPLTIAFQNGGFIPSQSMGGAMFLSILSQKHWIPAFWQITYTSGYPDGLLPRQVNTLVGIYAAMDILSQIAATNAMSTSHSLGFDGMSQSVSTPGPSVFKERLADLEKQKMAIMMKLKARYGFKFNIGTI